MKDIGQVPQGHQSQMMSETNKEKTYSLKQDWNFIIIPGQGVTNFKIL